MKSEREEVRKGGSEGGKESRQICIVYAGAIAYRLPELRARKLSLFWSCALTPMQADVKLLRQEEGIKDVIRQR